MNSDKFTLKKIDKQGYFYTLLITCKKEMKEPI